MSLKNHSHDLHQRSGDWIQSQTERTKYKQVEDHRNNKPDLPRSEMNKNCKK